MRAHGRCWHSRNRMDFSRLEVIRDELCATLLFDLGLRRARMTDEIECLIGIVLLFVMYVAWIFESDDWDE